AGDDAAASELLASAIARGRQLLLEGSLHEAAEVLQDVLLSKHDEPTALMHSAEVLAQMGRPLQAAELADRLLDQRLLTVQARSFMFNRRGIYLASAGDWTGARQSYELAVETGGQGQVPMVNKHALCNLANLYHFHVFRAETTRPDFSILERAIELYRAALVQDDASATASEVKGCGDGAQEDGIGGEIDRPSTCRHLAAALVLAGRPGEAVSHLQHTLSQLSIEAGTSSIKNSSREGRNSGSEAGREAASGEVGIAPAAVPAATVEETSATAEEKKSTAFLMDSLSSARSAAGDLAGAVTAGQMALDLVDDEPGLFHNMAVLLQKSGFFSEARDAWLSAIALDPNFSAAFAGLGHLEGAWGNVERQARKYFEESLAALRSPKQGPNVSGGSGNSHSHIDDRDAELVSMFLIATAVVPALYESRDHIIQVRRDFESGLEQLLAQPIDASSPGVENPSTTVGSGALGYYLIYQGFENMEIRRKLARAYWKFVPTVRYVFSITQTQAGSTEGLANLSVNWPDKRIERPELAPAEEDATSTAAAAAGITMGPSMPTREGYDTLRRTGSNSLEERNSDYHRSNLDVSGDQASENTTSSTFCLRRRIRVGFLSAFFYHHSVGLLTEGVVTRLDRRRFEVTAIFLQPHPISATDTSASSADIGTGHVESYESINDLGVGDDVYRTVREGAEHVLDVPANSLAACRHAIASLELDVLVFTEIGMNLEAYILSFARLARRSAVFWGHAVTSGISAADAVSIRNDGSGHEGGASGGLADGGLGDYDQLGGIDYFVSSWLFEDKALGRLAQRKYSETLYLMKGLTTRFGRPSPAKPGLVTRQKLGIPSRPLSPRGEDPLSPFAGVEAPAVGEEAGAGAGAGAGADAVGALLHGSSSRSSLSPSPTCGALYLVPQTLYKLHPDFDQLVAGVLAVDPSGCVVLIRAVQASLTDRLARRMSGALSAAGVRPDRVVIVPMVGLHEFPDLVDLADVVLDPFPVGGGRSSFEIFAVGTPIVMLYNRTSILQLTYGMYATMGMEGVVGSTTTNTGSGSSVSLVTHSQDEFVRSAVAIATDAELNARLRGTILANNHRLYERDEVVTEWEDFLEGIINVPRPAPVDWRRYNQRLGQHEDLAVDASDFPARLSWCSGTSGGGSMPEASHLGEVAASARASKNEGVGVGGDAVGSIDNEKSSQSTANPSGDAVKARGPTKTPRTTAGIVEEAGSSSLSATAAPIQLETRPDRITSPTTLETEPVSTASVVAAAVRADHIGLPSNGGSPSPLSPRVVAGRAEYGEAEERFLYLLNSFVRVTTGRCSSYLVPVYEDDDPMEQADKLREGGALDYLQYRWVGTVLCRGVRRLQRPVVWSTYVRVDDGPRRVHEGDDLWQIARWHCRRYSLGAARVAGLSAKLEKALPQHAGRGWLSSRAEDRSCSMPVPASSATSKFLLEPPPVSTDEGARSSSTTAGEAESPPIPYSAPSRRGPFPDAAATAAGASPNVRASAAKAYRDGAGGGCVTLAITTCKRLRAFLGTAEGLQALLGRLPREAAEGISTEAPRVCQVLIVDDGSSPADRSVMLSAFPRFTYVFKGPEDVKAGHAGSMNLVLTLTKYRYLLYVEDDWWAIHDTPLSPQRRLGSFLWRAMEVLTKSTERVSQANLTPFARIPATAQVLLNDQSTRNCAWGDTATCTAEIQGTAGW
ncbi:unnamed protein product, partial [Scytosiphon promiscuus]